MLAPVLAAAVALAASNAAAKEQVSIQPYASGLSAITAIASTPAEPSRLYVVEQVGRIKYIVNGRVAGTFLDIRDRVVSGGEQGLLSVAVAPAYAKNHRLYVNQPGKQAKTLAVASR